MAPIIVYRNENLRLSLTHYTTNASPRETVGKKEKDNAKVQETVNRNFMSDDHIAKFFMTQSV